MVGVPRKSRGILGTDTVFFAFLSDILREFGNFRHPGPRRVWKVGSETVSQTMVSCTRNHTFRSLAVPRPSRDRPLPPQGRRSPAWRDGHPRPKKKPRQQALCLLNFVNCNRLQWSCNFILKITLTFACVVGHVCFAAVIHACVVGHVCFA